jgi:hypothetical protein
MELFREAKTDIDRNYAANKHLLEQAERLVSSWPEALRKHLSHVRCEDGEVIVALLHQELFDKVKANWDPRDNEGEHRFDRCRAFVHISFHSIVCTVQEWDENMFGCMGGGYRTKHHKFARVDGDKYVAFLEKYFSVPNV